MIGPIRLPVQVGATALWSAARVLTILPLGVLLIAMGVAGAIEGEGGASYVMMAAGGLSVLYAVAQLPRLLRTRASDALVTKDGLAVEGGPHHGLRLAWSEIDPQASRAETVEERQLGPTRLLAHAFYLLGSVVFGDQLELAPDDPTPIRKLHLATKDGRRWMLAEAEQPGEQRSIDAVLETIQAQTGGKTSSPQRPPDLVTCNQCGAPVVPADVDHATCRYCSHAQPIDPELRSRFRASLEVDEATQAARSQVATLLRQPGATRTNATLGVLAVIGIVVWSVLGAGLGMAGIANVGGFEVGWALVAGALASSCVFVFGRAALASRRALRLLSSSFGARAPYDDQSGYGCRRCGAPLPSADDLVAACSYCNAENLLGLDLRSHVEPSKEHALSLAELVEARRRERRRWLTLSFVMLPAAVVVGLMSTVSVIVAHEFRQELAACDKGDGEACHEVAIDFALGISVAEDEAEAVRYELKACKLKHGPACFDLAERYEYGWNVEEDPDKARSYRKKACRYGHEEACADE